jgi:hypothetical protein
LRKRYRRAAGYDKLTCDIDNANNAMSPDLKWKQKYDRPKENFLQSANPRSDRWRY